MHSDSSVSGAKWLMSPRLSMPTIRLLLLIRQPADLRRLHVPHRLAEVVIVPTAVDAWGHHITCHRAAGIEASLCQAFTDDLAAGHHSDQPVVLANRNGAYIMVAHQFRELGYWCVRTNPINAFVH